MNLQDFIYERIHWAGDYTKKIIEDAVIEKDEKKTIANLRKLQTKFGKKTFYDKGKDAYKKINAINKHINKNDIHSVLDFGGTKCDVTHTLAEIFDISDKMNNAICVDIDKWAGIDWTKERRTNVKFVHSDKLSTIKSGSIDFILVAHTLHHMTDADINKAVKELTRILSNNGRLVLYEHDCKDKDFYYLLDIEHMLYDVVLTQEYTYAKFKKEHYSNYKSIDEWHKVFSDLDVHATVILPDKLDKSYYAIYKKRSNTKTNNVKKTNIENNANVNKTLIKNFDTLLKMAKQKDISSKHIAKLIKDMTDVKNTETNTKKFKSRLNKLVVDIIGA